MKEIDMYIKILGIKIFSYKKIIKDIDVEPSSFPIEDNLQKLTNTIPNSMGAGSIRPDLKELEKQVFNIEDKPDPIKVTCKSCEGITYDDDIDCCCDCGKEICANCGSVDTAVDPVTKDIIKSKYCEKCWSEV